jgi:hypothetical protein
VVTTGTQMEDEAYIEKMVSGDEITPGRYVMLDKRDTTGTAQIVQCPSARRSRFDNAPDSRPCCL